MKMCVVKGSILLKEESEAEKAQKKEGRTSKKVIGALLTTEKTQRGEVAPRNQEKRKRPLENRKYFARQGEQTPRHTPQPVPLELKPEKQADGKGNCQYTLRWNQVKEQQQLGI